MTTTTMYLRNQAEISAAARTLTAAGYPTSARALRAGDRYVINIVNRLEPGDGAAARALAARLVRTVQGVRAEAAR